MKTLVNIKSTLENLGYELTDNGNHWRSNALYRNGDNPTSLLIYKDSGVWIDYVKNPDKPMPLQRLVELSGGNPSSVEAPIAPHKEKEQLMSKVYPKSILTRLLHLPDFYKKRGISERTQNMYQCGYASAGKLYRRLVFPIFNRNKQIIGFSGRSVYEDNDIKWKNLGKKREWVFPLYSDDKFAESIREKEEVILCESIGDSMALSESGRFNNLVMFGLSQSSALLSALVELAPKKIFISLNNDKFSDEGKFYAEIATCKLYFKLIKYFDEDVIFIKQPILEDFGDMQKNEDRESLFKKWDNQESNLSTKIDEWKKINKSHSCFNDQITKKLESFIC